MDVCCVVLSTHKYPENSRYARVTSVNICILINNFDFVDDYYGCKKYHNVAFIVLLRSIFKVYKEFKCYSQALITFNQLTKLYPKSTFKN